MTLYEGAYAFGCVEAGAVAAGADGAACVDGGGVAAIGMTA